MLPRRDRDSQRAAPTDLALLYAIHLDNDRERATAQPKPTPNFKQRLRGGAITRRDYRCVLEAQEPELITRPLTADEVIRNCRRQRGAYGSCSTVRMKRPPSP
jgi:hypothetical protein